VESALQDGDVRLVVDLGGRQEVTLARLWRGQVLVDWEPDPRAGDCLLRLDLLRRLNLTPEGDDLVATIRGHTVAQLTDEHAALVRRLGGARRIELSLRLTMRDGAYQGGQETYWLLERGGKRTALLRVQAEVRLRSAPAGSPRTSRGPS
jgi:hypothetical protein